MAREIKGEVVKDFDGSYYINLFINGVLVRDLPEYVDYTTLKSTIKSNYGLNIPNVKDLKFEKGCGRKRYAYFELRG